ncbi:MAG: hypothetical protein RIC16_12850 [Rhodospirillales bacterium]
MRFFSVFALVFTSALWLSAVPLSASEAEEHDVQLVIDTILADQETLNDFCEADMNGMVDIITREIMNLASKGEMRVGRGSYRDVGNMAGEQLAQSC